MRGMRAEAAAHGTIPALHSASPRPVSLVPPVVEDQEEQEGAMSAGKAAAARILRKLGSVTRRTSGVAGGVAVASGVTGSPTLSGDSAREQAESVERQGSSASVGSVCDGADALCETTNRLHLVA